MPAQDPSPQPAPALLQTTIALQLSRAVALAAMIQAAAADQVMPAANKTELVDYLATFFTLAAAANISSADGGLHGRLGG
jgi:hypothetical protein